jgi:hypothetical protein
MINKLLRVVKEWRYPRGMATHAVEPVRRPDFLDNWVGMWIAVKDGEVIAAAYNSRELVPMVREKGKAGEGAVAQFVPPRSEDIVIGVG